VQVGLMQVSLQMVSLALPLQVVVFLPLHLQVVFAPLPLQEVFFPPLLQMVRCSVPSEVGLMEPLQVVFFPVLLQMVCWMPCHTHSN
jgi:hypothetical protein